MKYLLLGLIRIYQWTFSRLIPPNTCRFYPTCSHYGFEAVQRYGAIRGGLMAIRRVFRCNPWHPGGFDPVPTDLDRTRGIIINIVGSLVIIFLVLITVFPILK